MRNVIYMRVRIKHIKHECFMKHGVYVVCVCIAIKFMDVYNSAVT